MCASSDFSSRMRNISFPQKSASPADSDDDVSWVDTSMSNIHLQIPLDSTDENNETMYYASCSLFRNLNSHIPGILSNGSAMSYETLGSQIISLTVDGLSNSNNLSAPVRITFQNSQVKIDNVTQRCVFWNSAASSSGSWSDYGCRLVSTGSSKLTTCECSHLTNFAILFTTSPARNLDDLILSLISMIGCIVSIASLGFTLLLFAVRWKKMRSHYIVVLINLCIALIVANSLFLGGVNKTGNPVTCKVIAVLLHYFFLAAFFIMLVQGTQLLLYVYFPFYIHRKRDTAVCLVIAWVIPMIIVGVSLAATKTVGYGGNDTCWLSVTNGLLWAFVGPALLVILINFIILVIVIVKIARTKKASTQPTKRRVWATMWNVCMLTPVLGVTWVFGVISVTQDLVVFQYIFAIANSLQGFFIFIFHGLCYKKRPSGKTFGKTSQTRTQTIVSSRRIMARLKNHNRCLSRKQAVNWAMIAAAMNQTDAGVELQENEEDPVRNGNGNGNGFTSFQINDDTFSSSLQRSPAATSGDVSISGSRIGSSTDRTDLLF